MESVPFPCPDTENGTCAMVDANWTAAKASRATCGLLAGVVLPVRTRMSLNSPAGRSETAFMRAIAPVTMGVAAEVPATNGPGTDWTNVPGALICTTAF